MKCYHCEKKLNRVLRKMLDIFGFRIYVMQVKETGKRYPLCNQCGEYYQRVAELVDTYGNDVVLKALKSLVDEEKD
jgi:hypothetical protein